MNRKPAASPDETLTFVKATIAVIAWGASFIATKIALHDLPPGAVIWLRFGVGFCVLSAFALIRGEKFAVPLRSFTSFAFLGLLGITFHQWIQVNGLVTARASTTAWIMTTIPIFIALLGRLFLKETLGLLRMAGIAIAAGGVLLVVSHGNLRGLAEGEAGSVGDLLVLASALNWAIFSVLSRKILEKQSPTIAMLYVMAAGWLFSSFLLPSPALLLAGLSGLPASGWWSLAFLGFICSGLAYVYWYDALKALPAARVGAFLYLEPLVTVVVAALLLNEPVGGMALAGGMLILGGVWMVNRRVP